MGLIANRYDSGGVIWLKCATHFHLYETGAVSSTRNHRIAPGIHAIGVGEGTTPAFPKHFFQDLGIIPAGFYAKAQQPIGRIARSRALVQQARDL